MAVAPPFGGGTFIADKSIWARSDREPIRDAWAQALANGQILTCSITVLELLFSARTSAEFEALEEELSALRTIQVTDSICRAAIAAMRELAAHSDGYHRIPPPDYLIGACAQDAGIGVLHYDRDFDRFSEVMEFESRWAADPPALD